MTEEHRSTDGGFTLVEVLVALVILGVAVVAIVGVMVNLVIGSETQKGQAEADAGIRAYAEAIQNQLNTAPSANVSGSSCPSATDMAPSASNFTQRSTYPDLTFAITNIEYFIPNADRSTGYTVTTDINQCQTAYTNACPNGEVLSACSPGLYRLTLGVTVSLNSQNVRGSTATESILVRRGNS